MKKYLLSKEDFTKSFYYPASGIDLNPLVRFSHLTDTFVYVNLQLSENKLEELLKKELILMQNLIKLENESVIFNIKDVEANFNPLNYRKYFSNDTMKEYMEIFSNDMKEKNLWGKLMFFKRRIGNLERKLKLYYFTGEAIATYVALSQEGIYAPKIVCTIQSGNMDEPDGFFSNVFRQHKNKPEIWVRGFQPIYDVNRIESHRKNEVLSMKGLYNKKVQSYGYWFADSTHYKQYIKIRHVGAFCIDDNKYSGFSCKELNGKFKLKLINQPMSIDNFVDFDCIILTKNLLNKYKESLTNLNNFNIVTWESFARIGEYNVLLSSNLIFEKLDDIIRKNKYKKILMCPYGYEDEGIYLKEWIDSSENGLEYAEIRIKDKLDYIDIMSI